MNKALSAIVLPLVASASVTPIGNDTDAVVARGLFPLGKQSPSLAILEETVVVTVEREGTTTVRRYQIHNVGDSGQAYLATICGGTNTLGAHCGDISINGTPMGYQRSIGYLVDEGAVVSIRQRSRVEIAKCLEAVDGTVCGHEWALVPIEVGKEDTLEVSLRYRSGFEDRYWFESVASQLYLYTEKFWAGDHVPRIEVWIDLEGASLDLESWTPTGMYARYSMAPTGVVAGDICWRLDEYKPVKEQYKYQFSLLHPWSVDGDAVRRTHDEVWSGL